MKIILIGPMPLRGESLGGAKTAFKKTLEIFENKYPGGYYLIDTSRRRTSLSHIGKLILDVQTTFRIFIKVHKVISNADIIMINMSTRGFLKTGWIYIFYSKLFGIKAVVRFFGGDIYKLVEDLPLPARKFQYWIIKKFNLVCLETKQLISQFNKNYDSILWLPNTRDLPLLKNKTISIKKLLFLSHIRSEKGVLDIFKASDDFPEGVTVHFYGSLGFDIAVEEFNNYEKCTYFGKLQPEMVLEKMCQYDILILPTFYKGEGYPGVIIEALQLGMPIITTRWLSIPEIIIDSFNGILIPIKSPSAIVESVKKLHSDLNFYQQLSEGALESGELFRSKNVFPKLFDQIEKIANEK